MKDIKRYASGSVALCALLAIVGHASAQEAKTMYERLGGIHKIAMFVDTGVRNAMKDSVLMSNERFAQANKDFPAAAVSFLLTSYVACKTGGPQMYSGMDMAAVDKWFMFTPEQIKHDYTVWDDAMKEAGEDSQTIADFDKWWMDMETSVTPIAPMAEMITDKQSLYGRLGGIVPIALVVDDFVNRLATDKVIVSNTNTVKSLTDGHVSAAGLKFLVTQQLAAAAGGPWKYSGKTMADAHRGLNISEAEWSQGAKLLMQSLNKFSVPQHEQDEILATVSSTKGDIVGQ